MNDIYDIKGVLYTDLITNKYWLSFLVLLGVFFVVVLISVLIDRFIKLIKEIKRKKLETILFKKGYLDFIRDLDINDEDFYSKLSLKVRDFFEQKGIIVNPTKKTASELKTGKNKAWDNFMIDCRDAEYKSDKNNELTKEGLRKQAYNIIENFK